MMKEYWFRINGKEYNVSVGEAGAQSLAVNVNGADYQVEISSDAPVAGVHPSVTEKKADVPSGAPTAPVASQAASGAAAQVASPLPGVIVEVSVKEGQAVKAGQKVAVLEAMKMENEIPATKDGIVSEIHVNKGDSVLEGAPIVSIA